MEQFAIILNVIAILPAFILFYLYIKMYFLKFKLENHPLLIQKIEDVLAMICEKENIKVFYKTYDELNANQPDENMKVYGKYIHTLNKEHEKEMTRLRLEIESIEAKYGKPYEELCREVGLDVINRETLYIPRIILCKDEIARFGICGFYNTYFHELGHHFAHKELGYEHNTEENADKYAAKLVKENLPHYFLLFFYFGFWYRENGAKLTWKEKIFAFIDYLKYLIFERKMQQNLVNIDRA